MTKRTSMFPDAADRARIAARISWPQAAVLCVFCVSVVCTVVFTPPAIIDRIAAFNWHAIASGTVAVVSALYGIFGGGVVKPKPPAPVAWPSPASLFPMGVESIQPPAPTPAEATEDTPMKTPPDGTAAIVQERAKSSRPPSGREGFAEVDAMLAVLAFFLMIATIILVGGTGGCGSAQQQHTALNRLADAADPAYVLAIEACDEAEGIIIARPATTYENDATAMARIRETCDRVFGAFEALRIAHRTARAAIDGGAAGAVPAALAQLTEAWRALQMMLPEVTSMRTAGGES
jgi:hypothetical protein